MRFFFMPRLLVGLLGLVLVLAAAGCGLKSEVKKNDDIAAMEEKILRMDKSMAEESAMLRDEVNRLKAEVARLKEKAGKDKAPAQTYPGPMLAPDQVKSLYKQARSQYVKGDYKKAAKIFQGLAAEAPRDKLAPNARYWLGECYYNQRRFKEAITEYNMVIRDYPASHKAPDAMLKLAYSHHMLKNGAAATAQLRTLIHRYPKSRAARMVKKGQTLFRYP